MLAVVHTTMSVLSDSMPDAGDAPETRRPVRAVAAAIGLTVLALLASLVGGIALVVPVVILGLDVESVPVFVALTAAGQVGFLVVAYAYARFADVTVPVSVPGARDLGYVVVGIVLALAVAVTLSLVLAALDLLPGSVIAEEGAANPTLLLGLALLSVVLVAPAEEFLFRGVIQGRLRQAFGPVGAIAGASLLFGSLHLANYTGAIPPIVAGALLISVVGAVFGVLYEVTENLAVPVLVHGVYNLLLFTIAFLSM